MDNNAVAALATILVGLQNVITALREGKIALLPTFRGQVDENVRKFIWQLKIVFLANQIIDNRKFYIKVSYLMGIVANWYELNWGTLVNWNIVRQSNNMQLRTSLIERFDTAV